MFSEDNCVKTIHCIVEPVETLSVRHRALGEGFLRGLTTPPFYYSGCIFCHVISHDNPYCVLFMEGAHAESC